MATTIHRPNFDSTGGKSQAKSASDVLVDMGGHVESVKEQMSKPNLDWLLLKLAVPDGSRRQANPYNASRKSASR